MVSLNTFIQYFSFYAPTSIISIIFTTDALAAATLPIYPGLGQAPNMLSCIPGVLVHLLITNTLELLYGV